MAINLTKGQTINLNKDEHDLSSMTIGLGWKIAEKKTNFLGGLFWGGQRIAERKSGFLSSLFRGGKQEGLDLDAIAFLLDKNDKVKSLGNDKLVGGDIVFFNSLTHPTGTVCHSGDNRIGGSGANDDEQIVVQLNSIEEPYCKILFMVCIHQGQEKSQHFGMVESAYIRAVDAKGKEIARYALNVDPSYAGRCTMVFGEVYRKDSGWKFRAIGEAHPFDSFVPLLKQHLPT
jgi:tellurium resistance protein TerD